MLSVLLGALAATAEEPTTPRNASAAAESDEIVSLAAYTVKADRIEDFGLRVERLYTYSGKRPNGVTVWFSKFAPKITAIVPNTAAAKAGLQPGERILKSDGQSALGGLFSTGKFGQWQKTQQKKWAEVAAGKTNVTWTLEIESAGTRTVRTVKLVVPTPPPRWGASVWRTPEGRTPALVRESGPLAERSRAVLDNGIWILLPEPLPSVVGDDVSPASESTATGYEWHIGDVREGLHRIVVTQFQGRTQVLFETASPSTGRRIYLTSPSGVLERAWRWGRKENIAMMKAKTAQAIAKIGEVPLEDARIGFAHELDLWTTRVAMGIGRWPFELTPGYDANAIFAVLAAKEGAPIAPKVPPFAAEFLNLPPATELQQAMFAEAYGKIGAEHDQWAYTETSHSIEDQRVIVTRVDPSKSEGERCLLVSVGGKPPTPNDVQQWREAGGDTPKPLGDIPPLASIVDLKDLRIFKEDSATIIFELAIRSDSEEFSSDKFQALFRVNKADSSFEEIAVRMRDSLRVAGVVKITEAGFQVRFQKRDPAHPPQPVYLQGGGSARVVFMKFSRSFEAVRTDFRRVEPFNEAPAVAN